jgi:hypothetical protein
VELSDAIAIVRDQLLKAQRAQRTVGGRVLGFAVGKVSIEFSGEVKRTGGVGGDVKFWVFTANAKAERTAGSAQKVVVELIPQSHDGTPVVVGDSVDELPRR